MKVELFPFQNRVLADLRLKVVEAIGGFREPIQIKLFLLLLQQAQGKQ